MGLCELIGAKKMNYITEMIGKLKASSYPIIIWGGNCLEERLHFFLMKIMFNGRRLLLTESFIQIQNLTEL